MLEDSVFEFGSTDEIGDESVSAEFSSGLSSGLGQFEHHGGAGAGGAVAFGFAVPQSDRRERGLDGVRRPDVPVGSKNSADLKTP